MDTRTGEIVNSPDVEAFVPEERKFFVPVQRDLTKLEEANRQINLYSPCGCGSGKKFKFCCWGSKK